MGRDAITETERAAIRTCGAEMAEAARAAILPHFRQPLVPENKDGQGGFDPVTLADRAAEQAIREVLAKLSPADMRISALPVGRVRRTRLAQVPAAFWFTDDSEAVVICFRSVADYVFGLLSTAAQPGSEVGHF